MTAFGLKGNNYVAYLGKLNEAITEELANRFCRKILPDFVLINDEKIGEEWVGDRFTGVTYKKYRDEMWSLIKDIVGRPGGTEDEEQVFRILCGAYFNGDLLPFARLVKKTYPSGGLRKLADQMVEVIGEIE